METTTSCGFSKTHKIRRNSDIVRDCFGRTRNPLFVRRLPKGLGPGLLPKALRDVLDLPQPRPDMHGPPRSSGAGSRSVSQSTRYPWLSTVTVERPAPSHGAQAYDRRVNRVLGGNKQQGQSRPTKTC